MDVKKMKDLVFHSKKPKTMISYENEETQDFAETFQTGGAAIALAGFAAICIGKIIGLRDRESFSCACKESRYIQKEFEERKNCVLGQDSKDNPK